MTTQQPGEVAVVKPYYLTEEAYRMGHRFTKGMDDDTVPDDELLDLSPIKESARWANNIAPSLRAMAGYLDNGHGTYTDAREVAAILPGCEEDEPAEADLCSARDVFNALVKAWDMGAMDGYENTYDPESARYAW